jgi:hypothetical protein
LNPDPAADLTPDPTTFFIDFKDAKKIFFSHIFIIICPQANHLQTKKFDYLLKFVLNFILQALFQSDQHIYEKREGSGAGSVPLTNGPGSGSQEAQKQSDPDQVPVPDPQHHLLEVVFVHLRPLISTGPVDMDYPGSTCQTRFPFFLKTGPLASTRLIKKGFGGKCP